MPNKNLSIGGSLTVLARVEPVTGADLSAAIERLVAGKPVSPKQLLSKGCNTKWKGGE